MLLQGDKTWNKTQNQKGWEPSPENLSSWDKLIYKVDNNIGHVGAKQISTWLKEVKERECCDWQVQKFSITAR